MPAEQIIIPIEHTTPLDKLVVPVALPGALYGGESQAHKFIISATRNKEPYILSGTVTGTLINWSTARTQPLEGSIVDGCAVVVLPASCYAHPGRATITIFVTNDNTIAVYSCSTTVIPTETDEIIDPENVINLTNIQTAAAQAQAAATTAAAAAEAAGNITGAIAVTEATSTATYAYEAGSYFFYDGTLYRATDDIAIGDTITPYPTTGYNCRAVTVGTELARAIELASQVSDGAVRYDEAQTLTEAQKAQARENIGATAGAVRYDEAQTLTEVQKAQARTNIGVDDIAGVVKYGQSQTLTDAEKTQARTNIGAASSAQFSSVEQAVDAMRDTVDSLGKVVTNISPLTGGSGFRADYSDGTSTTITIDAGSALDSVEYDENYYLHFYDENGEELYNGPFFIQGGGGGGGSATGNASIDRIGDANLDIVYGGVATLNFRFTATDSSGDTVGDGVGTWYVGGITVASGQAIHQGNNSFDIGPYLTPGTNSVRLSVSVDTGGDTLITRTKTWTVNAVNMYFTWNYDDAQINTSGFTDRWTVFGEISKTTHTLLDGVALDTITTTQSNRGQSMLIPMQTHGAHSIERWLSATIGGVEQSTEHQYHEAVFVVSGETAPIIAISMKNSSVNQYDTLRIPFMVYDPAAMITDIELYVNGALLTGWTGIDRSLQHWVYTPTSSGTHTLMIKCGATTKSVTLTVAAVDIDAEEVSGYSFRFKASDLASNDAARAWASNGVNATYSANFDWINGGLKTETDENDALQQYLCIKAGTRMTINHKLFANDPKSAGMNYKIIFKVANCRQYDAQVGHCYADGIGIRMYAHESIFNSSGTTISVPYGEDEYIELEFDVYPAPRQENDGNYRYMMAWIDGVITTCRVYGAQDNFVQSTLNQEGVVLGSDDCDLYVYMVKAYPMLVSRAEHIDNFIMDAPNASEMIRRYNRNDILDESGEISYQKLMRQNPNLRVYLWDIPYMTNGKKDKVQNCRFYQFWVNGDTYYELSGVCVMTVQGTSSVKYIRGAANTDANFVSLQDGYGNDLMADGTQDETYGNNWYVEDDENPGHARVYTVSEARTAAGLTDESASLGPEWVVVTRDANRNPTHYIKALGLKINDNSCPITYSNTKVNFASCEQVNNMCNAIWYQRFNPYPSLTAHDCMEFSMGVQFIKDSGTIPDAQHFVLFGDDKYHMYSIANMGNSKKNVHVFHDLSNPNEVCIEVNDNDKDQMRMVSDDLSAEDWSGDVYFGMRYPDTKNPSQAIRNAWQRLVSWMASRNPNAYTGDALTTPETYGVYQFRGHDRIGTQVLRGTTVTKYAGTYTHDTFNRRMARMLSECEDYMVMDSFVYHFVYLERHTMVDNVSKNNFWSSTDLLHWDLSKAYDMDTSDGNNNQGQMVFDYGNEYNDDIGGMKVFNGADSVWFVFVANLYEACRAMFINREAAGAWSATAYHAFFLEQQRKVPERCWVECYWYDYLRTYEQGISDEWMSFLDGGQKTHQRKHYEDYEELYDASKYRGNASTSQNINFRAYTPNEWAGVEPKGELTVTMYNKMYISVDVGTTQLEPIKAQRGVPVTIDFSSGGTLNNTLIAVNTATMIQSISGMEQLYPDTCVFSMATRLRELTIGSDAEGYQNTFLRTLALANNTMLERLYAQNLPNADSVLDLSHCPSLLYLDAGGSGFTGYDFADGGLLTTAILEQPVTLNLRNLAYLTDAHFTINDYTALVSLRHENTPGVSSLALVNAAAALQITRLVGIDWTLANSDVLDRLYLLQGIDEAGYTISRAVLTGEAYVPVMTQRKLDSYGAAWPNLDVSYGSLTAQYAVYFFNADGSTIKDLYGNDYVQYIDRGSTAYDPIQAGEVLTPTQAADAQYIYTFSGWDNITGAVLANRNVTAQYTTVTRTYTVRWFAQAGEMLKSVTAAYGTEVKYNDDPYVFPTLADEESSYVYKVFMGWDKSTGFIRGDTDVYAIWDRSALPTAGSVELEDMSVAQIYGIACNKAAASYWTEKDHTDIILGKDFSFSNVQSQVLAENLYLNGETVIKFDGHDASHPLIKLFDASAPSFTLAIDYEFIDNTLDSTLIGAFVEDGSEGFRLRYNGNPDIQWGDKHLTVGYGMERGIVVIRHRQGSDNLYVTSNNPGNQVYNNAILIGEMVRTRSTSTDAVLCLGGVPFGASENDFYATGWIHWCKIWFDDLGNTVVQQLASWPHETLRMEYSGAGRYRLAGETVERCAASFLSHAPLSLRHRMNSTNTNVGGWDASEMRTFVNNMVFNGLPFCWQAMIKAVKITASEGNQSTATIVSEDKIFLAAYAEVASVSTEPYASEGTIIPWFTSNASRVRFCGIFIPDDSQVIDTQTDPTLLTDTYTVRQWDRWRNSQNGYYYIYVENATIAQHKFWGGYPFPTTDVHIAAGNGQGYWVRAMWWWLRSPWASSSAYFAFVYYAGYVYSYLSAASPSALLCGFCI